MRQLLELTRVRVLLFLREPEALFWVFLFPLVLAAILGWAFRDGGPEPSRIGLLPGGEALAPRLEGREDLDLVRFADPEAARIALSTGGVDVLVGGGSPPSVQLDLQRPEAETARLRLLAALDPDPAANERLALEPLVERGSRYVDYLVPGLLGMNLMGTGLWGVGFAIADARRRNLIRRLLVTPMRRGTFFLSFLTSRLVFLLGEVALLTGFGVWILGVPLRGSLLAFGLLCLLGALTFAGLGLLCASRAKTIEGVSGIINFVMMPMWLGSGVFFSYERFPEAILPLLRLLPLTALNDALRAVMLEGAGPPGIWSEVLILAGWAVGAFLAALKIFRWD